MHVRSQPAFQKHVAGVALDLQTPNPLSHPFPGLTRTYPYQDIVAEGLYKSLPSANHTVEHGSAHEVVPGPFGDWLEKSSLISPKVREVLFWLEELREEAGFSSPVPR